MQYVLFSNYVFKQIIIYGRQFEFTKVKVIKLAVEHYDYDTSCGNNNAQYDDSDHACLLSRVLKMEGANLNRIILWLWFFWVIFINILLLLILSLWSELFNYFCFRHLSQHDQEMHGWQVACMFSCDTQKQQKLHSLLLAPFSLTKQLLVC